MGELSLTPVAGGGRENLKQAKIVAEIVDNSVDRPGVSFEEVFPGITGRYGNRISAIGSLRRAHNKPHIDASFIMNGQTPVGVATAVRTPLYDGNLDAITHKTDGVNVAYYFDWSIEGKMSVQGSDELHGQAGRLIVAQAARFVIEPYTFALLTDDEFEPSRGLRDALPWASAHLNLYEAANDIEAINLAKGVAVRLHATSPMESELTGTQLSLE